MYIHKNENSLGSVERRDVRVHIRYDGAENYG